jgi:hypothetical protein
VLERASLENDAAPPTAPADDARTKQSQQRNGDEEMYKRLAGPNCKS